MAAPAIGIGQLQERAPSSKYALFNSQIFTKKIAKTCKKGVLQCSRVYKVTRFRRKNCLAIGVLWED